MQASQIDPQKLYAIRVPNRGGAGSFIARFKVVMVESHMHRRQLKPSASDYEHMVHGRIIESDVPPEELPSDPQVKEEYLKRSVRPDQIEDEYQKFLELKEKAEAETRAQTEKANRQKANALKLETLLYELTGASRLKDRNHDRPFEASSWGGKLSVTETGVILLLDLLTPKQS